MSTRSAPVPAALQATIGRFQLFALGFGSIIGSAWVVILNEWLVAGPIPAILGFLAGGVVILAVGACYAELTARIPRTGGEFNFALAVYDRSVGFFVGWFVACSWICVTIFEGLAVAWFLGLLVPALRGHNAYSTFGAQVTDSQLLIGAAGAALITCVNYRGGKSVARFQSLLTYSFLAVALGVLLFMLGHGILRGFPSFLPPRSEVPSWVGFASVFASCAFLLNGFQAVSQAVEERSAEVSLRTVATVMMAAIGAGTAFYCLAVTAASAAAPWQDLTRAELATLRAAESLPAGQVMATALLAAAVASLLKTWNAVFMMAARIILALARQGMMPRAFARIGSRTHAPSSAVLLVGGLNIAGLFLGRGAISALVDMSATSVVLCFLICSIALPILRRRSRLPSPYSVPGGRLTIALAIGGSALMAGAALLTPLLRQHGLPLEYALLAGWAVAGLFFWLFFGRKHSRTTLDSPSGLET